MSKLVEPTTYWVGSTSLNNQELEQYLFDTGQESFIDEINQAREEGLNDGEILCSFYAKACYAALTTEKNKNISRVRGIEDNVKGTIKSGHGCYDEETEVLTYDGWKSWKNVSDQDELATLNIEGEIEYHTPIKTYSADYDGEMIKYDSDQVSLLITPNHNMFACANSTKEGRKKEFSSYKLIKAEEIFDKSHSFLKSLPYVSKVDTNLDPFYKLLGFSIGDGSIGGNILSFHIKLKRKKEYLESTLNELGVDFSFNEESDKYKINIKSFPLKRQIYLKGIYNDKEKQIPIEILRSADQNSLVSLYDGLINSDGSVSKTCVVYDTTSEILAGQLQILCNSIGFGCNISQAPCYKNRANSFGDKPIYRCGIIKRAIKPEFNKSSDDQYSKPEKVQYVGKIYCAEVPNNTLYVRREGKPVWCGNSVFEHCQLNFMIRDCSRVFTHELVRHRVGTAFSQTSGRYVRTDSVDLVYDPILDPAKKEIEETLTLIEEQYQKIQNAMNIDDIKDFGVKKKITSAMRRVLPNGQANEIGFSVNLRSLRHTITMRTSHHAEWEIRVIFNQIFELVKEKYPAMFADAIIEEIDGINQISFEYEKI